MKVSLNWVRQFTEVPLDIDALVTKIGAQLGAVEEVIDLGKKYQGIVIAKVVTCQKHPNADKLSVCLIDDGGVVKDAKRADGGYVQVVCGAPNVREGLMVAWLPPGATVPSSFDKDPFVLEAREIRGEVSNGMLASGSELAISEDHNGILEIDVDAQPGDDFAEVYYLNDYIIDIENKMFTHRPDCFGILGVAREIAGIMNMPFISPDWYLKPLDRIKPGATSELTVDNSITDLVPRFMAVAINGVEVKPSPISIQTYLSRSGLRPINNVVDVTNYLMLLTGQPLHAYDADKLVKVSGRLSLETRLSKPGDKLKLLNGKELELKDESTILITSNDVPVGIGGVMGGADTEVDETTKNIVVECANFDMYSIRRTAMKYGLFTDAVTRFNKGQSALQNDVILEEAVTTMLYVSGGEVASNVFDSHVELKEPEPVKVTSVFVSTRLGLDISAEAMAGFLKNVEFKTEADDEDLIVASPFWRTDIAIPEDIVEEVGRLIGYDQLPLVLPQRTLEPVARAELLTFKSRIRDILSRAGANELLTYSFVHGNLLEKAGQDKEQAYRLSNALSPDLQYYRLSLLPSLLDKVHPNIKSGTSEFTLFELGKGHETTQKDEDGLPKELDLLSVVITADDKTPTSKGAAYYQARVYLDYLADQLGIVLRYESLEQESDFQAAKPFDRTRSARVRDAKTDKILGAIGEFKPEVAKRFKLPGFTAGFELVITSLMGIAQPGYSYQPLSKYPSVQQDISLKVPESVPYGELIQFLEQNIAYPPHSQHRFEPIDIYQRKGEHDHKQMTFRLVVSSEERTLTDQEVNALLDDVAVKAHEKFAAERL